MRLVLISLFFALYAITGTAQVGKTTSVRLKITPNTNGSITLNWPAKTFTGSWAIYKRINDGTAWPSFILL